MYELTDLLLNIIILYSIISMFFLEICDIWYITHNKLSVLGFVFKTHSWEFKYLKK